MAVRVLFVLFFVALLLSPSNVIAHAISDEAEFCKTPLDVVQIQDLTSPFTPTFSLIEEQIDKMIELVATTHPESHFGFSTFGDPSSFGANPHTKEQPLALGVSQNHCLHVDAPLREPDAGVVEFLAEKYGTETGPGRGDVQEGGVFEAVAGSILSPRQGWRYRTVSGQSVARVAVVVTNSFPFPDDEDVEFASQTVKSSDISESGMKADYDSDDCLALSYRSVKELIQFVHDHGVYLILLVGPGGNFDASGKFVPFRQLTEEGERYQGMDGLAKWYADFFAKADLERMFAAPIDANMMISEAFKKALEDFDQYRCTGTTSSTAAPEAMTIVATTTTTLCPPSPIPECPCEDDCRTCPCCHHRHHDHDSVKVNVNVVVDDSDDDYDE